ncbi:MAG: hypothetical protein L0Y80_11830 [Ignavibacteriae bacterium]|nr:hypothetical protein [Ignavibacteriota bacterium]
MTQIILSMCFSLALQLQTGFQEYRNAPCCGNSELSSLYSADTPHALLSAEEAKQIFEHFKRHEGVWKGKSTKGWTEESTVKLIANGSVIQMTSFDAHPNETMLTLMHMDSERLLLTHYCVARNQPRLIASKVEEGGKKITFEFLDATNLLSRDKGHMDKMIHSCTDENKYSTRWTWYQDGKEQWLEEIIMERKHETE